MDSMRGLRTSLPRTSSQRQAAQMKDDQLLQTFREAALSVTALYKQAAAERTTSYQQGYQDASDDVLAFLDKMEKEESKGNLSEGQRLRRWLSDKAQRTGSDDATGRNSHSDDEEDDDTEEADKRERSSSPTKHDAMQSEASSLQASGILEPPDARAVSAPPPASTAIAPTPTILEARPPSTFSVPSGDFAFRSSVVMPLSHDMDADSSDSQQTAARNAAGNTIPLPMDHLPRARRNNRNSTRPNGRGNGTQSLGAGAGNKRRLPLESWFDISGFNGKDGFGGGAGGGKRGRFT